MNATRTHEFPISAADYWNLFFLDDAYHDGRHAFLRLQCDHRDINKQGEGESLKLTRTLHLHPKRDLPKALAKVLRGASMVKERGAFDLPNKSFDVQVELPVIGKLVNFEINYTWDDREGGGFARKMNANCHVKLPLVGKKIEQYLLDELTKSVDTAHGWTLKWLDERNAAA